MAVNEKTREALALGIPPLPPSPPIEAIEAEAYEDSTGEESLQVWVILSDSTRDEDLTGEHVMEIKSALRERLLSKGIRLFPYIRLVKRSDYHPGEPVE
jgi:hypothetical protein